MQQMLESHQGRAAGLHLRAVVGIGRLLMHASDICADLGQTEQLVALLVQSYVQPNSSPERMLSALCIQCFSICCELSVSVTLALLPPNIMLRA